MNIASIVKRAALVLARLLPDRLQRQLSAARRRNPGPLQPFSAELPREFDVDFYRVRSGYLHGTSDAALHRHFVSKGIPQGRAGSRVCWRDQLAVYADAQPSVLEIGPFCNPTLRGSHVRYFDVLDAAGLATRAAQIGMPGGPSPSVDYVSATGDLGIVADRYSAVLSCHCIEHQTDLVRHFRQVGEILIEQGRYFLIIPDKRYCFDHFLAESNLAQVMQAHVAHRIVHDLESVIEHRALTTHNDTARHWLGDHADTDYAEGIEARVRAAMTEHIAAAGGYIDVHAWKFTPESFRRIVRALFQLDQIALDVERVYNTPHGRCEFTAVLRKQRK